MTWGAIFLLLIVAAVAVTPFWIEARRPAPDRAMRDGSGMSFARLSQGVTAYRWHGGQRGPVVVAVHGLTTPSQVWDSVAEGLVALGYRVLTYDLYGRGLSDAPAGPQDAAFFLRQLNDLLDDQGVGDDVTLMGYSMGGSIATAFAAQQGHRLERLILVAPAGIAHVESGFSAICRSLPWIGDWIYLTAGPARMRREIAAMDEGEVPGLRDRVAASLARRGYLPAVLASRRGMLARIQRDAHRAIAAANLPVIAVWGGQDRVIPLTALGQLAQWNREVRHEVIDQADHAIAFTHGQEIVDRLRDVFRELFAEPVTPKPMKGVGKS